MRVIVNRNALLEVLNVAAGIAASRTTTDILKCVRLTARKGELLVSATDLEVALRVAITQVEVAKQGELLVPAEKLMQIVRESLDETLTLEAEEETCHIRGTDSHFEVYGQNPKEFPPVPEIEGEPDVELDAARLAGLIERTSFAVAKENTRYAINGVLWAKQGKKMMLVATDGRRLAKVVGSVDKVTGENVEVIVPAKAISVLQRILANAEGTVGVRLASNQILVQVAGYVLSSALVEGHFPNYDEVIPKDSDRKFELNTEDLLSAVRRAALLTNEQSEGVRLGFEKEKLVLSSRAPEQGEATISIPIENPGEPLAIGFNPTFLADALKVVGTDAVNIELKAPDRPGVIKAGQEFLYVVMPVNLS